MLLLDKPLSYTRSSYVSDVFCDELLLIQDIGYMSNTLHLMEANNASIYNGLSFM